MGYKYSSSEERRKANNEQKKFRYWNDLDYRESEKSKARIRNKGRYRKGKGREVMYGVNQQDFELMKTRQDNRCAICLQQESVLYRGKVRELAIDHDKRLDKKLGMRMLLCSNCNRALGLFKEDITRLENAIAYIEYWRTRYG